MLIFKVGIDIYRETMNELIDKACDDETAEKIKATIVAQEGVIALDEIKTRLFGSKVYVDIEIACDGTQSLYDAHRIAERVHRQVEELFPGRIKHCSVHVNPR